MEKPTLFTVIEEFNRLKKVECKSEITNINKVLHSENKCSKTQLKNAIRELSALRLTLLTSSELYPIVTELESWITKMTTIWDDIPKKVSFSKFQKWLESK